jgi:hypothetical protein
MEGLPDDLARDIISAILSRDDLKSVRLVDKRCSRFATERLFKKLYVRFRECSLQKLLAISRHPELGSLVTEIVYEADGDVRQYWTPTPLASHLDLSDTSELVRGDERYLGVALDETSRLAASMTNLRRILNVRFQDLTHPELESDPADQEGVIELPPTLPESLRGHGVRAFFSVMRAAVVAELALKYLEVSPLLYGLHYNFLDMKGLDMRHTSNVFVNLERILMYVNTGEGELGSQRALRKGSLATLLTNATHLRHLSLGFDQRPDESIALVDILGPGTWRALKRLEILGLNFHLWEIADFVERHPDMVRFGLANCKLHSGSLRLLLEVLRNDLSLRTITLDGALGDTTVEFDFLESSRNQTNGRDFVLGRIQYPRFEPGSRESE